MVPYNVRIKKFFERFPGASKPFVKAGVFLREIYHISPTAFELSYSPEVLHTLVLPFDMHDNYTSYVSTIYYKHHTIVVLEVDSDDASEIAYRTPPPKPSIYTSPVMSKDPFLFFAFTIIKLPLYMILLFGHVQDSHGSFDSQTTVPWSGKSESQAAKCT